MAKHADDANNAARASFHVSNLLAKKLKPFVKECTNILSCLPMSRKKFTVCQYIVVLADSSLKHSWDVGEHLNSLRRRIASFKFFYFLWMKALMPVIRRSLLFLFVALTVPNYWRVSVLGPEERCSNWNGFIWCRLESHGWFQSA